MCTEDRAKQQKKLLAINSYVVPILGYSFGIIKWSNTDQLDLNRQLRVMLTNLTKDRYHHPKSALERITLPRNIGGRGILDII
jgi:hypothetical protein